MLFMYGWFYLILLIERIPFLFRKKLEGLWHHGAWCNINTDFNRNYKIIDVQNLCNFKHFCCDMGQNDTIGKIELIHLSVLSTRVTNYKNDIQ